MTMLPDIDEQAYDDYQQQQFGQSASSRIAGLGFDHSSGNLINGLGALIPSSDALTNPLGTGNAPPPTPPPVQEPTPPPPAEAPTPDQQPVEAPAPQPVAPSPLLQRPPPMQPNDAPAPLPAPDAPVTTPLRAPSSMQPGQDTGYAFPVQGFKGPVNQHWGDVNGGSDLFAPRGTPVVAMRGGRVIESGANPVGGNAVLIQGDDGNQYYYAHFDASPSVKVGQDVTAGTYLGPVGDTGDAKGTGTHLHLGIGPDIRLGADKYGGTGGDYDAVGLLRSTLEGKPPQGNQVSYEPMAAQTTAGMSGGGQLAGKIGDAGRAILSGAADSASWLGEQGQKALQAVLITEGGLNGARGDRGMSAGPLQFYEGGQLANFAKQAGLTLDQAKTYVEQHPNEAVQWAIGTATNPGYLGGAIAQGIAKGLTGADLATFAQRVGQVSVSPERAGQNFNALFAGGGQLVSDAADAVRNNVFAPVQAAAQSVGSMFTDAQTPTPRSASSMFAPTSTDQVAASASSMALPPAPAEPQASPVERLKSAFSDFVDSIGGTAGSVGGKLASSILAPDTSTPPPRSSMPLPSDALTNPTPYENTPATGPMAPPTRPTVFDRLGEAIGPFAETAILGTPEDRAARATQPSPPEFRPLPDDQIGPGEILSSAAGALFGQPFGQVQSQAQKQEAVTSAQQAFAEASPTTGLGPDITLPGQEQPTHLGGTLIQGLVDQVIQNPLVFAPGAALGEELTNFGGTIVQDFLPQLGSTAGRLTAAAINGAVQNAIFEVGQPNATPQSIGEQFLAGAGFGGALHGGGELASSLGRRVLEGLPSLEPALRSRQRAEGINPFAAFGGAEEPTAARRPSEPSVAVGGETGQSRLPGFEDTPSSTAVEGPTTAEGHPVVTSSRVVTGPVEQVGAAGTRAATMAGDLTGEPAANDVERMFNGLKAPPREAPVTGPTQIFGPEGDVISTISRAEGEPGLTSIVRTGRGAEVGEANAETRQRMPNIEKVAPENADIRATIQRTAEENPQLMDAYRRGVITHKQLIEDLAPRLGMTADDFLKSPIGKAYNAEELLALNATMINAEAESVRAANRIAEAGGIANLTPEDKLQFARQQLDAARLQLVARGGSSEAGRTLNQQKIAITEEMARSVVGGNERVAAERSLETATERQSRTDTLVERDRGLQAEKKAAVTEAENITRRRQPTRNPEVQKVVDEPTPLDKMSEVARIDREIIDARRARETERVTSLTRERDGIVADVRGTLETKLQAALDARAAAEPVSATMDSAHRAQGQRLLSFVRKEVDAALNPMTQARTAGQLGDAVHKALLKALKAADAEGAAHSKHLTDTLNAISRAYDDLSAYHAMSLEEKTADFSGRAAKRAEAAEKRAEAARNAGEPEKLLKALQDEIAAERKLFKGKETTRRALADQQRLRELAGLDPRESVALQEKNRTAQASGTKAWLEAQRKQAQQESTRANEELQRSHQKRVSVAGRQREVARRLLENMGGDVTDKALQVYVDLVNEGDMLAGRSCATAAC
jgi:murein DD-endopeptidase MepM/ murein hydrolase activator NlpD